MCKKMVTNSFKKGLQKKLPKSLKPVGRLLQPLLFSLLGIDRIDKIYEDACNINSDNNFAEKLFHKNVMNIRLDYQDSDLEKIPKNGSLIVVANHPYGAIDGIALLALLKRARPDVKLMVNYILGGIPNLKEYFFLVDSFERSDSSRKSLGGIRKAIKWIKNGHVLGIFPAGEVSTYHRSEKMVIDREWSKATGMIIKIAKSPVQNVFFHGENSKFFQFLGKINPLLRTLWLARECGRSCNHDIPLKIGDTIPSKTCKSYKTSKELMSFLKNKTYALKKIDNSENNI